MYEQEIKTDKSSDNDGTENMYLMGQLGSTVLKPLSDNDDQYH